MSDPSRSATSERPCYRCRTDEKTPPCALCPLYGGWLERRGLADEPRLRRVYAEWVAIGGWTLLWRKHRIEARLLERADLVRLVNRFPATVGRLLDFARRTST